MKGHHAVLLTALAVIQQTDGSAAGIGLETRLRVRLVVVGECRAGLTDDGRVQRSCQRDSRVLMPEQSHVTDEGARVTVEF